jgi:hypothetical protein
MRLVADIHLIGSEDDDQLDRWLDLDKVIDDSASVRWCGGKVPLAASASNQQVLFTPEVTNARWIIVIASDALVTVKLNATTAVAVGIEPVEAVETDPLSTYQREAQPGVYIVGPISSTTPITTLYLSNPDTVNATSARVFVVGEAT